MEQETNLPRLANLNNLASIKQLEDERDLLKKYSVYGTFERAIETINALINKIEKE